MVVLELNDDSQPSASEGKVSELGLWGLSPLSSPTLSKDPPPWVPAVTSHTTSATSDSAETHLVRAVNTGIIDVGSHFTTSRKPPLKHRIGRSSCSRVRGEAETPRAGTSSRKGKAERYRKGESTYVISALFRIVPSPAAGVYDMGIDDQWDNMDAI